MIDLSYSDSGPSMAQGLRHKNTLMKQEISRAQRYLLGASQGPVLLKTGLALECAGFGQPRSAELPLDCPPGDSVM